MEAISEFICFTSFCSSAPSTSICIPLSKNGSGTGCPSRAIMPSLRAMPASSTMRNTVSSNWGMLGLNTFSIDLKLAKNAGSGTEYMTAKKVPPKTIRTDCWSINGAIPPPAIIAAKIMPTAPTIPSNDAISMSNTPFSETYIQDLYHSIYIQRKKWSGNV